MRIRLIAALMMVASSAVVLAAEPDRPAAPDGLKVQAAAPLSEGVRAERDLEYVPEGGRVQSLDLYLPGRSDKPLPLVVWIHGGGWTTGSKADCPALPLLTQGYAVASINYRLSQQAIFPAQIQDCLAAIRWLRANSKKYSIDPSRVGVWGSSAGGHLVALVGTAGGKRAFPTVGGNEDQSDRVQAVCDWFGPTDFTKMDEQASQFSAMNHGSPDSPESHLLGGAVQENKDKALLASPIHYISKDDPPFLIMHGTTDGRVPVGQSDIFADALKKAGVDVLLQKLPGSGHGGGAFNLPAPNDLVKRFFDKHLKGMDVKVELLPDEALPVPVDVRDGVTIGPVMEQLIGLTDEQRAKLLEIRRKYRALLFKEHDEAMAVLTETQRQQWKEGMRQQNARPHSPEDGRESARAPAHAGPTVQATITRLEVPVLWIKLEKEVVEPIKVTADENTVITLDGKPAVFADLKVGQHVAIEHPSGTAVRIEASSAAAAPAKN